MKDDEAKARAMLSTDGAIINEADVEWTDETLAGHMVAGYDCCEGQCAKGNKNASRDSGGQGLGRLSCSRPGERRVWHHNRDELTNSHAVGIDRVR